MVTSIDDRKGLVKVYWEDIRQRVAKVEPRFAKIVDALSPDKSFPLYLAYYPYGALKGDTISTFLPNMDDSFYRLTDSDAPQDVQKNLGYGRDSAPLAMLLEKNLELFVDLKSDGITIPRVLYTPGVFFPFTRMLSRKSKRIYASNGALTMTSGARSVFMLPNIGCATNHHYLQRDFNVQTSPPKSLYEHWYLFKELINSATIESEWRSCLMYFSSKWVEKLYNDRAWQPLKLYFHELGWEYFEYQHNNFYYDLTFSMIQKKRNLKPNPYLTDTARHLFTTALGAAPGYAPAINDDAMPLELLQKIFVESYGLKKYLPTIMQPYHFYFENSQFPVYYSLQNPSTHVFSPKSRKVSSTLSDMLELSHIMNVFTDEFAQDGSFCSDTVISDVAKQVNFSFYHNKQDRYGVIKPSTEIPHRDQRFNSISEKNKVEGASFAADAPFIRGCIAMNVDSEQE